MRKYAGRFDKKEMKRLAQKLRPGDLVNYEVHLPDQYEKSISGGLRSTVMSGVIGQVTGPEYHSAIVADVDRDKGEVTLVESFIGKGAVITTPKEFARYGKSHSFHFYRPNDVSAKAGRIAGQQALAAAAKKVDYPISDLIPVAMREFAAKRKGHVWRKIVKRLDRGSAEDRTVDDKALGICSHLPTYAWGKALGGEDKFLRRLGVRARRGTRLAVSPRTISKAARDGRLRRIGILSPLDREKSVADVLARRMKGAFRD